MKWGVEDPEAWLDTADDRVLRLWEAYWRLEPWGMEWNRHASQMVLLDSIYAATVNPHLKKRDRHIPRGESSFMPGDYAGEGAIKRNAGVGIEQQMNQYAKAYRRGDDD